jgi:HK97 family phage portal protein
MDWLTRLRAAYKAFTLTWAGSAGWWNGNAWLGATGYDYARAVGDGRGNAIVVACLKWQARVWPEAPCGVFRRADDGDLAWQGAHALTQLLERPNPFYSRTYLWAGTLADYALDGNAYWWKNRAGSGRPVELWWVPANLLEPRWPEDQPGVFISHYQYTVNGQRYTIPREDIVHFRNGVDPYNPRKGYSDLKALVREIATDNEAANWTASLLRNMAMPGAVVTPGQGVTFSREFADRLKLDFAQKFGGDNRGQPIIISEQSKVDVLGFSPEQMTTRDLRQLPEERVSAVFGTPAIVVGLGAGLARSTFANFAEAREAAYESGIMPMQAAFSDDLQAQLMPDFGNTTNLRAGFDTSRVRVLQEDRTALYEREAVALKAGAITVNEYRTAIGKPEIPQGGVFLLPATTTVVPSEQLGAAPEPPAAAPPVGPRALPEAASLPAGEHKAAGDPTEADLVAARAWAARQAPDGLEGLLDAVTRNGNGIHG